MTFWRTAREDCDSPVFAYNHREERAVLLDELVPVTSWMDANGDDCEKEVAEAFVAGRDGLGFAWGRIRDFNLPPH